MIEADIRAPVLGRLDVPILIGAFNKMMVRTAGRTADGVLGHGVFTDRWWKDVVNAELARGAASSGRDAAALKRWGWLITAIDDTDPQQTGVPPHEPKGNDSASQKTAGVASEFLRQAREILKDDHPANFFTMRGIDKKPHIPTFEEVYGLRAAAIAVYPMYRGLARLVSMNVLDAGQTLDDQMSRLEAVWNDYDFFFIHFKYTDSTGEDGNFDAKVKKIEELDAAIPRITAFKPKVLIVTGDHSTPSFLRSHSWHPVPTLLVSDCCRPDGHATFGENTAVRGGLGQFEAKYLMTLALSNAGRLGKYGA